MEAAMDLVADAEHEALMTEVHTHLEASQDPYLFSGTVAENIAFGNPDASLEGDCRSSQDSKCPRLYYGDAGGLQHTPGKRRQAAFGWTEAENVNRTGCSYKSKDTYP